MALERISDVTFASGEDQIRSSAVDFSNGFIYFGLKGGDDRVVKVRLSTMLEIDAIDPFSPSNLTCFSMFIDTANGFLYPCAGNTIGNLAFIVKVRLSDFTIVSTITRNNQGFSAIADITNGFAYIGCGNGVIVKVNLSTFGVAGSIEISTAGNLNAAVIDTVNGFGYFSDNLSPAHIVKIKLSDLTQVGSDLVLNSGENNIGAGVIDVAGGYAYFGDAANPSKIIKIKLSDFTRDSVLTLDAGNSSIQSAAIDLDDGIAYFGTGSNPAKVAEVRLSDFTQISSYSFPSGEFDAQTAAINTSAGNIYFGLHTSPGKAVKFKYKEEEVVDPPIIVRKTSGGVFKCRGCHEVYVLDTRYPHKCRR